MSWYAVSRRRYRLTFKSKVDSKQRCMRLESFQHRLALRRDVASAATKTRLCRANQLCCTFISAPPRQQVFQVGQHYCTSALSSFSLPSFWLGHSTGSELAFCMPQVVGYHSAFFNTAMPSPELPDTTTFSTT